MQLDINQAIRIIRDGGVIIYPTDTAFGIGCRIDDPLAVTRLFKIRERSLTKATPILVNSKKMALKYFLNPPTVVFKLMDRFWPGALTIVSSCKTYLILDLIRGGGATVGLRMPDHQIPLKIIDKLNVPIIGTSANFSGQSTPYSFESLDDNIIKLCDGVLNGVCNIKRVSTVVDCTSGKFKIIRQGAVIIKNHL